jgi:hypothetical protein
MPKVRLYYNVKKRKYNNQLVKSKMYLTELNQNSVVTPTQFYREWKAVYKRDDREELKQFFYKLNTVVTALLERGYPASVPYLGKFQLKCRSCGVETKREAGRLSIKSLKVSFTPSPELKKYFDVKNCILVEKRESQEEAEEA